MSILLELKRRNVTRVAAAYIVTSWLIIQVAVSVLPIFDFGHINRYVVITLAIAFIPVLMFAWAFELTPDGFKRDEEVEPSKGVSNAKTLDRVIIAMLAVAVSYFAFDKFIIAANREATIAEEAREEGRSGALIEAYSDKSIAALPFVNRSGDPEQDYFSDGITQEILGLLAQMSDLRVVSRSSSFAFKGQNIPIPELAEKLNVKYILDGMVRRTEEGFRINVQLIDGLTDSHIWTQTYTGPLDDVFAVQDDIAAQVATAMNITLVSDLPKSAITTPEAYELYLQGDKASQLQTPEGYTKGLALFEESSAIDPDYSIVWVNRANIHIIQAARGFIPFDEGYKLANAAADEAARIDSDLAASVQGKIAMMHEQDYHQAARLFKTAIDYKPNDGSIINSFGVLANVIGQTDQAIEFVKQVSEIVPTSPIPHINLASWYADIGELDMAVKSANKALEINPQVYGAPAVLARVSLYKGDWQGALDQSEAVKQPTFKNVIQAIALHELGNKTESDQILQSMIEENAEHWAYFIAMVYAWQDETDQAFAWLDRGVEENQNMNALKTDAFFKNLHTDSRWEQLLKQKGLSTSQVGDITF